MMSGGIFMVKAFKTVCVALIIIGVLFPSAHGATLEVTFFEEHIAGPLKKFITTGLNAAFEEIKKLIVSSITTSLSFVADHIRALINGLLDFIKEHCGGDCARNIAIILLFSSVVYVVLDYFFGVFTRHKEKAKREIED